MLASSYFPKSGQLRAQSLPCPVWRNKDPSLLMLIIGPENIFTIIRLLISTLIALQSIAICADHAVLRRRNYMRRVLSVHGTGRSPNAEDHPSSVLNYFCIPFASNYSIPVRAKRQPTTCGFACVCIVLTNAAGKVLSLSSLIEWLFQGTCLLGSRVLYQSQPTNETKGRRRRNVFNPTDSTTECSRINRWASTRPHQLST